MSTSLIAGVRDFLCSCPLLSDGKLNVDFLGPEPTEYAIERVAGDEVLKRYSDGGRLKQFVFLFSSREWIGRRVEQHLKLAEFYERFSEWLEEMSRKGTLPQIGESRVAQSIGAVSGGILYDQTGECAKYQIRCRLVYFEPGDTETDS